MAKATWVPLCFLVERGQQIKVFSQLTKKGLEKWDLWYPRFSMVNSPNKGMKVRRFLKHKKGAYYKPITALDFEGLYPSIMMAHNLCYSSLVMDPKYEMSRH